MKSQSRISDDNFHTVSRAVASSDSDSFHTTSISVTPRSESPFFLSASSPSPQQEKQGGSQWIGLWSEGNLENHPEQNQSPLSISNVIQFHSVPLSWWFSERNYWCGMNN